jgi:hypothetical protein
MRNPPTDDEPEPTDDEPEPTPEELKSPCNKDDNYTRDENVLFSKVYSLLEPGLLDKDTQEDFIENAFIMKQILDEDITDYIAATVLRSDFEYNDDRTFLKSLTEAVETGMEKAMMQILRPWGLGSRKFEVGTYLNKKKIGTCLKISFDRLIGKALGKIKEEYNYPVDVEDTNGGSSSERSSSEGSAANPSKLKALKLKAPDSKYSDIYNNLSIRLEPPDDFDGVTLKTKSKGTITKSAQKDQYNNLKKIVHNYEEKNTFRIDDFTPKDLTGDSEFSSYDEFTNLLKIMRKIEASKNSVTLSFKEAVDNKITADSLNKIWGKGISGQDFALHKIIEEVAKLISGRRLFRDAGGSVFLGRIADVESSLTRFPEINKLIEGIKSSTEFAERLYDGAGQSTLKNKDEIKVDYFTQVFNSPTLPQTDFRKYINPDPKPTNAPYIIISPSIDKGKKISDSDEVTYSISFPYFQETKGKRKKDEPPAGEWKFPTLNFDGVIYDLSLLVRYFLELLNMLEIPGMTSWLGKANDEEARKKCRKQCTDMIWVLLNLKRMGDHGQAERAKADNGIFESGDQLAAAYGMMIEVPTIATYSRQGYGNHFILYGAELSLDQLIISIKNYLDNLPVLKVVIDDKPLKELIDDKVANLTEENKEQAQKILTLVSGLVKLDETFKVSGPSGKNQVTIVTVLKKVIESFDKMNNDLLGSACGMRETAKKVVKCLPLRTILTLFAGGRNKIKSDIETTVNTFMLLINILREMYVIASGFGWLPYVKAFIIGKIEAIIPAGKVLPGVRENLSKILNDIKTETETGLDTSKPVSGYINRFFDNIRQHVNIELDYILKPIIEFIEKVESIKNFGSVAESGVLKADGNKLENYIKVFTGEITTSTP